MSAPTETLAHTPLHGLHVALGARMMGFAGYDMPVQYDGILAEHNRVRTGVGLFDVSHMGEVRVCGPGALEAVNRLVSNNLAGVANGRAQYSTLCHEDGTIVDDLISYRLSDEEIFICVNASNRHVDFAHISERIGDGVTLTDESDDWAQIAVQGPNAPTLLGRVLGEEAEKLRPFRVRQLRFDDTNVYFATTGYTGEKGGEIYVPTASAAALWTALMEKGGDLGVGPVGLGARDTLRLEMGYCLYGNDIDRTTTPLEAGLGWVTKLGKEGGFVGRDAIAAQKEAGVPRKLVALELTERGIPRHDYPVLHEGEVVGHVTSGTRSPSTGKSIGLAYVRADLAADGTVLAVDCRGRQRAAVVVSLPFYTRKT